MSTDGPREFLIGIQTLLEEAIGLQAQREADGSLSGENADRCARTMHLTWERVDDHKKSIPTIVRPSNKGSPS